MQNKKLKPSLYAFPALLILSLLLQLFCLGSVAVQAEEAAPQEAPAASNPSEYTISIPVKLNWDNVPQESVPKELIITFVPDGVAFMAATLHFNAENNYAGQIEAIAGTRTLLIKGDKVDGLDNRVLGSVEQGYTIEYYPAGQVPADGAQLANQDTSPQSASYVQPETSKVPVQVNANMPAVQTKEGESLSDEEYKARQIEEAAKREAEAQGLNVNRNFYIGGIVVCGVLIVIVIVVRILLSRH